MKRSIIATIWACVIHAHIVAQEPQPPLERQGHQFVYALQENGDRIPDYSYCGYEQSEKTIPLLRNRIFIRPVSGDATKHIQSAIDYVSELQPDENGFRGAVLLGRGQFEIKGELFIQASGVVLRGSGTGPEGTTLWATGDARETVVNFTGLDNEITGDTLTVTDAYVPVNAQQLTLSDVGGLQVGHRVRIRRIGSPEWIAKLGSGGDRPGNLDLYFERIITGIQGDTVELDVPLTNAIAQEEGGATVIPYAQSGRLSQVGVEFLNIVSRYEESNPKDEEHAWHGIAMQDVENAWVRQIHFKHLAGSAVLLQDRTAKVTVEDCVAQAPISEIAAGRRNVFYTMGQQTLFQHCFSEYGYHDFIVGNTTTGPNAFIQCRAEEPYSFSGALGNWVTGLLLDDVYINGHALGFQNREGDGNRAGWTGANGMMWNCQASVLLNYQPPTAANWAFGCWAQFKGQRSYDDNTHITPRSFFYAQLEQRLERDVSAQGRIKLMDGESSTSPSVELAQQLIEEASRPAVTMLDWIGQAKMPEDALITEGIPDQSILSYRNVAAVRTYPFVVKNGWLTWHAGVVTGRRQGVRYWRADAKPLGVAAATAHLTRYVPGRIGRGLTDDLDQLTGDMLSAHTAMIDYQYALWYDRRRDDHERFRRMDGEVWSPFLELPFARSGQGRAWDGLSKYDLTRYNSWYFKRLADYATLGTQKGLMLFNQHYHQHNILEAGAHYADFPWRPTNNINGTPFVEPVNYAADKRIFYGKQFYDVSNPEYAALHRAYIRHQLESFPENTGVIHSTSAEYTGPFHFVAFWLKTIGAWEKETGKEALVALSTTKDVQDQVLADPELAPIVDIIDIRYWAEGEAGINAPPGGLYLSPRQHVRIQSGGKSGEITEQSVYRAVRRYREAYPDKPVLYNSTAASQSGWGVFMAGGSMANIPVISVEGFAAAVADMKPEGNTEKYQLLSQSGKDRILYPLSDGEVLLPADKSRYEVLRIDNHTGQLLGYDTVETKQGNIAVDLHVGEVLWIR